MSRYADIIKRLTEATGPSMDLSRDCLLATGLYALEKRGNDRKEWLYDTGKSYGREDPSYIRFAHASKSLDDAVTLFNRMLPGWGWRGGSCHLSDDCFVFPDYNCPTHGERLKREFSVKINGQEWSDYTDVDLRPAGRLPIAILISMFTALDGIDQLARM